MKNRAVVIILAHLLMRDEGISAAIKTGEGSATERHDSKVKTPPKLGTAMPRNAHEEADAHDQESAPRFGPDKGVTHATEALGFKLHELAYKNFKIELTTLNGQGKWQVPRSSIVYSREETHAYQLKNGYFKSVDIRLIDSSGKQSVTIACDKLKTGDQIAVKGVGFLMIVDQATFGEETAHEH